MSHRIRRGWKGALQRALPFGLGLTKPKHFREFPKIVWENRDNLGYAWRVLTKGVCDGCALGVAGLHDWTIDSIHLCMTRLQLLRLNTMPALDPAVLADVAALSKLSNAQLRELGRLPVPLLRTRDASGFVPISWSEALGRIAAHIRTSRPERLAFYLTSRALTNEVYYVAQKVARFLGTNNIDNAARLCHSPSTAAMRASLGVAATTCSYRDWWGSDFVIFFGSNAANDQPVAIKYLHEAKKAGTRVVLVNPLREPGMDRYWVPSVASSALFGTDIADYWFPVSQGGDVAFLSGVLRILTETGAYDREFVARHTTGFDELNQVLQRLSWADLEAQAGLPQASMREFAELLAPAKTGVLVWSMGITQHACGADAVQMIINLGLLKGWVGREKCGLMPIRGHSGVQGGAEMGAYATAFPGGRPLSPDQASELSTLYGFPVPAQPGLTAAEMVEAAARGDLDVLYSIGGNFLRTLPDPDFVARALARVPLRVHQDIIVTDQMLLDSEGDVILLPAKTRYEQEGGGTETTTERRVIFSPEIPRQVGEARSEWRILLDLAAAVDPSRAAVLGCQTAQRIREEIARIIPSYDGIQHLRNAGDSFQIGGPHLCAGGAFPTSDGKARLRPVPLPTVRRTPDVFIVSTRRGRQFNTIVWNEIDPLTGAPRDAVLISPEDAARLDIRQQDRVRLVNAHGQFEGRAFLAPLAPGNLQVHWPEGNVLLPRGRLDPLGKVPDYNAEVRVEVLRT